MALHQQNFDALLEKVRTNQARQFTSPNEPLSDTNVKALIDALSTNTHITTLHFTDCKLSTQAVKDIAQMLKKNTRIVALGLDNNAISDEGAMALGEMLKFNSKLSFLKLNGNAIGDKGAKALADGLLENTALVALYLRNNKIGDAGGKELADVLRLNDTLHQLFLATNAMGDEAGAAFAKALKINDSLLELGLGTNQMGDKAACAFADTLSQNTTLQEFSLYQNPIGNDGLMALAEMLKTNKTLTDLRLPEGPAGDTRWLDAFNALIEHDINLIKPIFGNYMDYQHAIDKHCVQNNTLVTEGYTTLEDDLITPYDLTIEQWDNITSCLPAIMRKAGVYGDTKTMWRAQALREMLADLPEFNLAEITTPDALTTTHGEYSRFDDPRVWQHMDEIVANFNATGYCLNALELLNEDGTIGPLLTKAIELDRVPAFFTQENWAGASKADLNAVLNALPEDAQQAVINRQQLAIALERNAIAGRHGR